LLLDKGDWLIKRTRLQLEEIYKLVRYVVSPGERVSFSIDNASECKNAIDLFKRQGWKSVSIVIADNPMGQLASSETNNYNLETLKMLFQRMFRGSKAVLLESSSSRMRLFFGETDQT
jgi:hypothetical protein